MRVYGCDMETDELECVLANLIFDGSIKGYIAHKRNNHHLSLSPSHVLQPITIDHMI
jgi:hypothetical protein